MTVGVICTAADNVETVIFVQGTNKSVRGGREGMCE